MLRFALGRLLQAVPVLLVVITMTFLLVHSAPGGPFSADKAVPEEVLEALEAQYNLNQPLWQQYVSYLGDVLQGDMGPSFKYPGRSVNELILSGLGTTAELGFYAMLVAIFIGVIAGVTASMRPNTAQDYVPMTAAMIGICMPSFLLGPLLVLIFGIHLEWLPVSGWNQIPGDKILPAITLGTGLCSLYCPALSRRHAGSSLPGLYSHRSRQGPVGVFNYWQARTARRPDSGGSFSRASLCRVIGWVICGRNYLPDTWLGSLLCAGRL